MSEAAASGAADGAATLGSVTFGSDAEMEQDANENAGIWVILAHQAQIALTPAPEATANSVATGWSHWRDNDRCAIIVDCFCQGTRWLRNSLMKWSKSSVFSLINQLMDVYAC